MLQSVQTGELSLEAYRGTAPETTLDELTRCAEALRGARVLSSYTTRSQPPSCIGEDQDDGRVRPAAKP